MKNFWKKIAITLTLVMTFALCFAFAGCGDKNSKEQKCYELMIDVSYEFKNPSSVRILSGTVNYYPDTSPDYLSAYLRLSATNGYGATTSGYYFCGYSDDGSLFVYDLEEYGTDNPMYSSSMSKCKVLDDFDIDKVNKMLDKKWGN